MSNLKEPINIILPYDLTEAYRNQILTAISTCGYALNLQEFNVMTYVKESIKMKIEEMARDMGTIVINPTLVSDFEKYDSLLNRDFISFLREQHIIEPNLLFLYPVVTSIDAESKIEVDIGNDCNSYSLVVRISYVYDAKERFNIGQRATDVI